MLRLYQPYNYTQETRTLIKCLTLVFILTYGEPNLLSAIIALIH